MRLNEICQLFTSDIEKKGDIYNIKLNRFDENGKPTKSKRFKNKASRRIVPIHPMLIECGFVEYASSIRKSKSKRLFPLLPYSETLDSHSDGFSRWFSRFLNSIDIKDGKRSICFHSFRHTFRDACRNARLHPDLASNIGGWKESDRESSNYGDGAQIKVLFDEISKIEYPELDLSHLKK